MRALCLESFKSCLTENKEYEVLAEDGQYILVVEDNDREVWNWIGIFKIVESGSPKLKARMKINWEII